MNPLAGCLPTLATLPVFLGLYRALTNAASDGLLTDGFFWIPSLGGPASMAQNGAGQGLGWLFPLADGVPPIGWHDAASYLVLPALLVVSQFASQKLMQPAGGQDPSQASANAILKFLPFMVGYFSLNVPSGLTLYWIVNNILTTAQTVYLRSTVAPLAAAGAGSSPQFGASDSNRLPPNPPSIPASQRIVDVEVLASGSRPSALAAGGDAPGAKFAARKAAEKGRGRRQAAGPNVNWAGSAGEEKKEGS